MRTSIRAIVIGEVCGSDHIDVGTVSRGAGRSGLRSVGISRPIALARQASRHGHATGVDRPVEPPPRPLPKLGFQARRWQDAVAAE